MATIERTRERDPYGDLEYRVSWEDNDGVGRERFFESYRAAGRYAEKVEAQLFDEARQALEFDTAHSFAAPPAPTCTVNLREIQVKSFIYNRNSCFLVRGFRVSLTPRMEREVEQCAN